MESSLVSYTVSEAHPETLDYLSSAWCNFAMQTLQEKTLPLQPEGSLVLVTDNGTSVPAGTGNLNISASSASYNFNGPRMNEATDILPPWKSNDLKSWIWMQQALHPELNYKNTYFDTKRWFTWRTNPFKSGIKPIKKWLEDMKQKRKEESRLKRAEVHGAISIAGVAAALAAIAAADSKTYDEKTSKESVVASAAALVASQCAEMACAMGASREQLAAVISSAKTATNPTDILTLTAAAATSIRGADRLKARKQSTNRIMNGTSTVLSIKESEDDDAFDFEYGRSLLSKGALLNIVEKFDGKFTETWVSIDLNSKAEVILKMKQLTNMFILKTYSSKKECVVMDLHVELYSDPEEIYTTCYLMVLETNRGMIKLDMSNDYASYKLWMSTVKHLLMISLSLARII